MNILYIAQSCNPSNGSEDQIGWSIPWEASKHHCVHVVTRPDLRPSIESFFAQSKNRNITIHYVDIPSIYKKLCKGPLYTLRLQKWNKNAMPVVRALCSLHHIQIIHQITPIEFRSIGNYGLIPGIKYICGPLAGGQAVPRFMMSYLKSTARALEYIRNFVNWLFLKKIKSNNLLNQCDCLLFANQETSQYLGIKNINCPTYVYSDIGINHNLIRDAKNTQINTATTRKLLVAGRLIPIKGLDFLLDVLETLPHDLNYSCRIVGGGPLQKHLNKRCQSSSLRGKVEIVGPIPYKQMQTEYAWADALVFPSFREASGTVIIEAMANGIPVITANRCGAPLLLNSDSGWLYDGTTSSQCKDALRQAIITCLSTPELTLLKGQNALLQAKQHTWEKKFQFYSSIYQKLLNVPIDI